MTEREIGEQAPEGCEVCGESGAVVRRHPNGGKYEACIKCHRDEVRQAKIDARQAQLANLTDAQAAPLLRQIELAAA